MIYTITMIQKIEMDNLTKLPTFGEREFIGYFNCYADAYNAITKLKSNNLYDYCIIEELKSGVYVQTSNRYLFKWNKDRYIQIDAPIELHKVTNFCR